jgi:hypothetical protein
MKPIKIEIKNIYAGYMPVKVNDKDSLEKMINFILSRSEILINEFTQREANNKSGIMSTEATSIQRNVLIIKQNAERVKNTMEPMAFFQLGRSMEKINTSLAVVEGFIELRKRSDNGKASGKLSAESRAKVSEEVGDEVEKLWHEFKKNLERERASKITARMRGSEETKYITSTTVRRHIKKRNLRS